jgi:hypothetical protein
LKSSGVSPTSSVPEARVADVATPLPPPKPAPAKPIGERELPEL